jgi:hypothetical protein
MPSPTVEETRRENDDGGEQQEMNQTAHGMAAHEPENPQHRQHARYPHEHGVPLQLGSCFSARSRHCFGWARPILRMG